MIAQHVRPLPLARQDDERLLSRTDAVDDLIHFTVTRRGLSDEAETAMRHAILSHVDPLLHLADSAVVAQLEAEATDRRVSAHRATHDDCSPCDILRLLLIRQRRFHDRASRAFSELVRGRR